MRYTNTFDLDEYFKCILSDNFAVINSEQIDENGQKEEYIMLALRTAGGIDLNDYKLKFGVDFEEEFAETLKKLSSFFEKKASRIFIKPEHLYVQNSLIINFFK